MARNNTVNEIKAILSQETDFIKPLLSKMLQEILEAEMNESIGASSYERAQSHLSYRAGYYSRQLVTRIGSIELRVPRDREGKFSTALFECYQRSEKALLGILSEVYTGCIYS